MTNFVDSPTLDIAKIKVEDLPASAAVVIKQACSSLPGKISLFTFQLSDDQRELGLGPRALSLSVVDSLEPFFPKVKKPKEQFFYELQPLKNPFLRQTRGFLPKTVNESVRLWYERILEHKQEDLQNKDLFNLLRFMVLPVAMDANFIAALTSFWSVSTNTFHFKFGMMTPNLLDLAILFGLRPRGKSIDVSLAAEMDSSMKSNFNFSRKGAYGQWITLYMGKEGTSVTDVEYVAFFLYWLSKYVVCSPQFHVEASLYPLAYYLATSNAESDCPVALGKFVLGNLYSGLNRLLVSNYTSWGGPLWILQVWGCAYFEQIRPSLSQSSEVPIHGLNFLTVKPPFGTLSSYLHGFYHLDLQPSEQQVLRNLMEEKPCGPGWLIEAMVSCTQERSQKFWKCVLQARDLPFRASLGNPATFSAGVETYNPHYAALQFGFKQLLPYPLRWTWNVAFLPRRPFANVDNGLHAHSVGAYMLSNFCLPDDILFPEVLPKTLSVEDKFTDFWAKYMLNRPLLADIIRAYGTDAMAAPDRRPVTVVQEAEGSEAAVKKISKRKASTGLVGKAKRKRSNDAEIPQASVGQTPVKGKAPKKVAKITAGASQKFKAVFEASPLASSQAVDLPDSLVGRSPVKAKESEPTAEVKHQDMGGLDDTNDVSLDEDGGADMMNFDDFNAIGYPEDLPTDHAEELPIASTATNPPDITPAAENVQKSPPASGQSKKKKRKKTRSQVDFGTKPLNIQTPVTELGFQPSAGFDFDFDKFLVGRGVDNVEGSPSSPTVPVPAFTDTPQISRAKAIVNDFLQSSEIPNIGESFQSFADSLKYLQEFSAVSSPNNHKATLLLQQVPELIAKAKKADEEYSDASKFLTDVNLQSKVLEERQCYLKALAEKGRLGLARKSEINQAIDALRVQLKAHKKELKKFNSLDVKKEEYEAGLAEWKQLAQTLKQQQSSISAMEGDKQEAEEEIMKLRGQWIVLVQGNQL